MKIWQLFYTLWIEATKKQVFFFKCIPKSNVIKKNFWVLVFSIRIWYLPYPTDRSIISNEFSHQNIISNEFSTSKHNFKWILTSKHNFKWIFMSKHNFKWLCRWPDCFFVKTRIQINLLNFSCQNTDSNRFIWFYQPKTKSKLFFLISPVKKGTLIEKKISSNLWMLTRLIHLVKMQIQINYLIFFLMNN